MSQQTVLAWLQANEGWHSLTAIEKAAGRVESVLSSLERLGDVEGRQIAGRPKEYRAV